MDVLAFELKIEDFKAYLYIKQCGLLSPTKRERFVNKKFLLKDAEYADVFGLTFETVVRIVVVGAAQKVKLGLN